jgi:hypothetical protein
VDRLRITGTKFSKSLDSATFWVLRSIPLRQLALSYARKLVTA